MAEIADFTLADSHFADLPLENTPWPWSMIHIELEWVFRENSQQFRGNGWVQTRRQSGIRCPKNTRDPSRPAALRMAGRYQL
jgi:hypothetical protein